MGASRTAPIAARRVASLNGIGGFFITASGWSSDALWVMFRTRRVVGALRCAIRLGRVSDGEEHPRFENTGNVTVGAP